MAPRPLPVLPAGSTLCWLRGDRLVRLDHLPPRLQRLPLRRLVSIPVGGKPQSHQPCHGALHHARTQTLQWRGGALLRPWKTPVHQPTVLRWRGERGSEAVWRHGGTQLWLSLIGCAPPALLKTEGETEGDRKMCALSKLCTCICFKYFIILTNKASIPQTIIILTNVNDYLTRTKFDRLTCAGQTWIGNLVLGKKSIVMYSIKPKSSQLTNILNIVKIGHLFMRPNDRHGSFKNLLLSMNAFMLEKWINCGWLVIFLITQLLKFIHVETTHIILVWTVVMIFTCKQHLIVSKKTIMTILRLLHMNDRERLYMSEISHRLFMNATCIFIGMIQTQKTCFILVV